MTSKAGHTFTAGPCEVDGVVTVNGVKTRAGVYTVTDIDTDPSESDLVCEASFGDAHFIAEAFNVVHETGLTPRQLAERCAELLAALKIAQPLVNRCSRTGAIKAREVVRAAIAKAEGGAA